LDSLLALSVVRSRFLGWREAHLAHWRQSGGLSECLLTPKRMVSLG
jgi:hypothetical protein